MSKVRTIAFYLPQFYPNPMNDEWWGKGFTEWTNVTRAKPQFRGHYQPHLPADLGFYDLRVRETRLEQAELARRFGIHGFCYYHYWFEGKRILEYAFEEVLSSGEPDLPFCLCWANESWTRVWEGKQDILLEQTYSAEDDLAHIRYLIPAFKDPRYIRVNGRPLFLIYRSNKLLARLPEMLRTWNAELEKAGLPELYLVSVRNPPEQNLFDAAVDFYPPEDFSANILGRIRYKLRKNLTPGSAYSRHNVVKYSDVVDEQIAKARPDYKMFLCPTVNWDNSSRRGKRGAFIMQGSTPDEFRRWFDHCVRSTIRHLDGDERIVFVNAWNEWAEGTHLEPDQKWGTGYLEAVASVLEKNGGF